MVMMPIKDFPGIKPSPVLRPIALPNAADQAAFTVLDGNGDGKLSKDEWTKAGWTEDRLQAFDGSKNGEVSEQEFMQARRFEREFNSKDFSGDGSLSKTELDGFFHKFSANLDKIGGSVKEAAGLAGDAIMRCMPPMISSRFSRFDADNDGKVSKEEYIAGRRTEERFRPVPIRPIHPIHPIHPGHPGHSAPFPHRQFPTFKDEFQLSVPAVKTKLADA